ncbi:MAG TPA: PhnA protein, partial [Candidatus Tenderia electrophaga]|nr:PhnA protein [Candidatus Tenderia electrophaga]
MNTEQALMQRSGSKCELCSSDSNLVVYEVPPVSDTNADNSIMVCEVCHEQINHPDTMDVNHWRCLNDSMWSQVPAVQVMAWRLLKRLSSESWAQDLVDMLYFDDELQQWAEAGVAESDADDDTVPTK